MTSISFRLPLDIEVCNAYAHRALDDHDLFRGSREGLCPDPLQKRPHGTRFIVDGNDDRNLHYDDLVRHLCLK